MKTPAVSLAVRRWTRGRRAWAALAATVLVGLAARAVVRSWYTPLVSDSFQYILIARSLARGDGFVSGGSQHPDLSRPPVLPVTVAAVSWVTGDAERAALLVTLAASALAVVPLFFLTRRGFGPAAALAALPLAAFSCLVASGVFALPDAPFLLLALVSAVLILEAGRRPRIWRFLAVGFAAGLASLAREEGLAWVPALAVWAWAVGGGGVRAGTRPGRWSRAGLVLAGAIALYAPYVLWASARLGRWTLAPGIEYLSDIRGIADRFGLREVDGPALPWTDRARFLLTADRTRFVVESYFETGVIPDADPASSAPQFGTWRPDAGSALIGRVRRRIGITLHNLSHLPSTLRTEHFLPAGAVILGFVGLATQLARRRGRRALLLLFFLAIASLAPVMSHLEGRFLFPPFALGLVVAAAGWATITSSIHRFLEARSTLRGGGARGAAPSGPGAPRLALAASACVSVALTVVVAISGFRHVPGTGNPPERIGVLKQIGAIAAKSAPPGPILAVQPNVSYWAGRPYRAIPVAPIAGVLDYARAQGAAALVFEGQRDLEKRPALEALVRDERAEGLTLLARLPHPQGGEALLFLIGAPGAMGPSPQPVSPARSDGAAAGGEGDRGGRRQ